MKPMRIYDIIVVGAGPAGIMAALTAAQFNRQVFLVERNDNIGKKILLTGKGRCNLTNTASLDTFIERFGRQGAFLRSAFNAFFNQDLIDFFKSHGLELKTERQGRVFPITDKACSIVETLKKALVKHKVDILYQKRLRNIKKQNRLWQLDLSGGVRFETERIILATGGVSFQKTGSTGDGFQFAQRLGHTIVALEPALVPLKTQESWSHELQGLSLRNIRITFIYGKKSLISGIGELMFTHFGVSGPLVLDLSNQVVALLRKYKSVRLLIDLKPGLTPEQIKNRLLTEFKTKGNPQLNNIMKRLLPGRLIQVFIDRSGMDPTTRISQVTRPERHVLINLFKTFPLTITGSLPVEKAMVTAGGISTKEINHKTMESRLVPGLYFAGELIDGAAASGGYNLQQAFSTGYLAGRSAANTDS